MRSEEFPAHGGNLEWAAGRYGYKPEEFLDFSSNVNPLGPPRPALDAARDALKAMHRYPEPDAGSLKRAFSRFLGVGPESIMLGNGSTELIHHLCRCLKPGRVLIVSPAFGEYESASRSAGAEVVFFTLHPEDGFPLDTGELSRLAAGADMVFFCNPASPSGTLYPTEEILAAHRACMKGGGTLVVDESFMGFCTPPEAQESSVLALAPETRGLSVISTMTKLFALAGVRGPGYVVASPKLISDLENMGVPWRVNSIASAACRAALLDGSYIERTRESVSAWRERLRRDLEATGFFRVYPSAANFLLLGIAGASLDAGGLADALGRKGILIRNCGNFHGLDSHFIRVAVLSPDANRRLVEAIREIMEKERDQQREKERK